MDILFFASPSEFRNWLEQHHATATELLVGFYKKASGKPSITWPEAVEEALSFGWIDGVRRNLDEGSYTIRFTPRRPGSIWSSVNIQHIDRLAKLGRMTPAGLQAFEARDQKKSKSYSYEASARQLGTPYEQRFRADPQAWDFFQAQAPSYQKAANWWVMSAKREETRLKRLAVLMADSRDGRRLAHLVSPAKKQKD
jgi:uncharacterized protein YdeI (YjbR/CyaY-like superfamily)